MSDLNRQLKKIFLQESRLIIDEFESQFQILQNNKSDLAVKHELFRLAHNFKGAAGAIGYGNILKVASSVEDILSQIILKEEVSDEKTYLFIMECNDFLSKTLIFLETAEDDSKIEISAILEKAKNICQNLSSNAVANMDFLSMETPIAGQDLLSLDIKTITQNVNKNLDKKQENLKTDDKSNLNNLSYEGEKLLPSLDLVAESIKVDFQKIENLADVAGELVILHSFMNEGKKNELASKDIQLTRQLGRLSQSIYEIVLSLRVVPLDLLFQKLRRVFREAARALDKKVQLNISGDVKEIDKQLMDQIYDPLVHILRNAIDHGIEGEQERLKIQKPDEGVIDIHFQQEGHQLVIIIKDNGRGLDKNKIIQKAVNKGLISSSNHLSEEEVFDLIFLPGFSTRENVTEFSGRGFGMDIVKTNIESLGGEISLKSKLNMGTEFTITLPLKVSIIEGLILKVREQKFVVPLWQVDKTLKYSRLNIQNLHGVGEILILGDQKIPLIHLNDCLNWGQDLGDDFNKKTPKVVLLAKGQGKKIAFAVDDVISQQQVVVKSLGSELSDGTGFRGSSILGDGRPAMILNLFDFSELKKHNLHNKNIGAA